MGESAQHAGPPRWATALTLCAALAWGTWLRVEGLADVPLYGDENHSADLALVPLDRLFTTYDVFGTHVPLPLLQRLAGWLVEPGVLALRLPAVVGGLLALALTYAVGRRLVGAPAAALATVALALNPLHLYYSRFARAYAITVALSLALIWLLDRAEQRAWRDSGTLVAIALTAALAPWVHLSSAGSVAGLALAAIGLSWARGGSRAALRPLLVFSAAAGLCLLLFLPVWDQVIEYLTKRPEIPKDRPSGLLGIVVLMAGGVAAAGVWLVGLPCAGWLLWRRRRASAVLFASAVIGPAVFLLATLPHGMEYAYARYMLNAVPVLLLALAWLALELLGARLGYLLGVAAVVAAYVAGPQSPLGPDEGEFANTYLALYPLEPFDEPFTLAPEVYRTIAADPEAEAIIEFPILDSRSVLLYRSYARTHQKRVLLGVVSSKDVRLNGPYAFVGEVPVGRKSGAQYLVVHKDVKGEVKAYWSFVYDSTLPRFDGYWNRIFMRQHQVFYMGEDLTGMTEELLGTFREMFGKTFYEDWFVAVWKLKSPARRGLGESDGRK